MSELGLIFDWKGFFGILSMSNNHWFQDLHQVISQNNDVKDLYGADAACEGNELINYILQGVYVLQVGLTVIIRLYKYTGTH